jgi:hypothetical protein
MPADAAEAVHKQDRYENPKNENSKNACRIFKASLVLIPHVC